MLCYHSRFTLEHRKQRHNEIVEAFKSTGGAVLGITTQVCEMSLDLDADVLITEDAPISSIIQRLGRCNRRIDSTTVGEVYIYTPDSTMPYNSGDLHGIEGFINHLVHKGAVSQSDLEKAMNEFGSKEPVWERTASFFNSGPYAVSGDQQLRDIDDASVPAVLSDDIARFVELQSRHQPTDGLICPVPRPLARERNPSLPRWLAVAPGDHYSEWIGFCNWPVNKGNHHEEHA